MKFDELFDSCADTISELDRYNIMYLVYTAEEPFKSLFIKSLGAYKIGEYNDKVELSHNDPNSNKLNFDNMFIIMGTYGAFWGFNSKNMIFNDCTFVGKCAEMFRFCELNRCAVTCETLQTNNTPFQYVISNFCWYKVLIRKTSTVNNTVMMGKMDTCYIEGKILCPASSAGVLGNLSNCCV